MAAAALPPAMIIDIPRDNAPPQNNVGSQADESTVARENSAPPSMEQAESSLSVSSIMSSTSKLTTSGFIERVQARVRPDEVYREEIVRSIFGEVGTPVEGERRLSAFSLSVVAWGWVMIPLPKGPVRTPSAP